MAETRDPIGPSSTAQTLEMDSQVPIRATPPHNTAEKEAATGAGKEHYGDEVPVGDLGTKDEKHAVLSIGSSDDELEVFDPFVPFPHDPGVPEENNILRIRSIVLGCILGALVNASNVYLGESLEKTS